MIARYTATAQVVHPVYCVEEKLWYTEEGVSAKSLQSLQLKLPGVKIKDYYPQGMEPLKVVAPKPRMITDPFRDDWKPKPLGVIREKSVAAKLEDNEPLDIPPFLPEPVEFKKVKPKRSYKRVYNPQLELGVVAKINWKLPENIQTLRSLMAAKLPVVTVADRMGCTRNAIIGACHRNNIQISNRGKR